jgi:hypothetical protein
VLNRVWFSAVLAVLAVVASAAGAAGVTTEPAGVVSFPGEGTPVVVADRAGDVALVTTGADAAYPGRVVLLLRRRAADGSWGAPQVLARRLPPAAPAAGLSADGGLVVAWVGRQRLLNARSIPANGPWGRPFVVRARIFGSPALAVNADGDAVVTAGPYDGSSRMGVLRDGAWTATRFPAYATPSAGIDAAGVVYAAGGYADRGGQGQAFIARYDRRGRWSSVRRIDGVGQMVQEAELVVSPRGSLTVSVGVASRRWVSTVDTEAYFTTGFYVLHADSWQHPLRRVWRQDGAVNLTMTTTAGDGVRLAWEQWRAPAGARRPTHAQVRTQQVLPSPGPVVRLASQPETLTRGFFALWVVPAAGGAATVVWQGLEAGKRALDLVGAARVKDGAVTERTVLPGSARSYRAAETPSVAGSPRGSWLAWSSGASLTHADAVSVGLW